MEKELVRQIEEYFYSMDETVKDEEILIFLDKNYKKKFDRKIYNEIREEITISQNKHLTPRNFAKTYYQAYNELKIVEYQAKRELDCLKEIRQNLSAGEMRQRPLIINGANHDSSNPIISSKNIESSGIPGFIQMSEVENKMQTDFHMGDRFMVVEFEPLNLWDLSESFLANHSIQCLFGKMF